MKTPPNDGQALERLRSIRHVALDLDGTLYKDGVLFGGVEQFLATLEEQGVGYTFLTNNSSKSRREYVARLCELGLDAHDDNVFTSADATIEYLRECCPKIKRLFVLGTPGLCEQFAEAGYTLCGEQTDNTGDEPDAVVVGFDTTLGFERLCRAAHWIVRGKAYLATHPDFVCPTHGPTVLIDCGSICAALNAATGRIPSAVPGKPSRWMLDGILKAHRLQPSELAMVGDRLYTDMAMAAQSGALGVLVLTGEATAEQAAAAKDRPELIVDDVVALGHLLKKSRKQTP